MKNKRLIAVILSLTIAIGSMAMFGCGSDPFTVTFDGDGGTLVSGEEVQTIASAKDIVAPTYQKDGYYFEGWSEVLKNIVKDTKVVARWAAKRYNISFNSNGGNTITEVKEVEYKGQVPSLPTPTREGYIFNGWKYNEQAVNSGDAYLFTENITLAADWVPDDSITYTITYNTSGATSPAANPTTYKVTDKSFSLKAPKKNGYIFLGWKEKKDPAGAEPRIEVTVEQGTVGNLTFTAYFKAITVYINRVLEYTTEAGVEHSSTYNGENKIEREKTEYDANVSIFDFKPSVDDYTDSYWMYIAKSIERRVQSWYKINKDYFDDMTLVEGQSGEEPYYEITLYAFYVSKSDVYLVTFVLSNYVKGQKYDVFVGEYTKEYTIRVNYGETLGDKLVTPTLSDSAKHEEIYFKHWYYLVDGQKVKMTADTILNSNNFSLSEGIVLYPQLYPTWY